MGIAARLRQDLWWLLAGSAGMLAAALVGPQLTTPAALGVRWSGVLLLAVLGGVTTALVGPTLLPLAHHVGVGPGRIVARGRRLRPLTQGAAVGFVAAAVTAVGVSIFPHVLAPVELRVGHGLPDLLLSQLQWAVPTAGVAGAALGLTGWAAVTQRDAVNAFGRLVRYAGTGTLLCWGAALASAVASVLTAVVLSDGSVGAGPVAVRAAAVVRAGAWWPIGWTAWALATLGLLAVLVLLAERAHPQWRLVAVAATGVAVTADLVSVAIFGAALPALAPAAVGGAGELFVAFERVALVLSALGGNAVYGVVGLVLVRTAGRRLHPLVRLLGLGAFSAALMTGLLLLAAPAWLAPLVVVSIALFVAFAWGLGWQLAVSRRSEPALEMLVRRAVRTLVPLHPLPFVATVRDAVAIDLSVDAERLTPLLPDGLEPVEADGRACVTVLAGVVHDARVAGLPAWLGLASTPLVMLRVPVRRDGPSNREEGGTASSPGRPSEAVTFLRGWADGTFTAATIHWLTELQLSRVDLEIAAGGDHWEARGSAGSLQITLEDDPRAPLPRIEASTADALVSRGGRLAAVRLLSSRIEATPAGVARLRVPFLERLDAEVLGAALLSSHAVRTGRARWQGD